MDIKDKKEIVLQKLQSTTDAQLNEEVYEVLYPDEEIKSIAFENLPNELKQKINRAMEDYKSGRYISHEQLK